MTKPARTAAKVVLFRYVCTEGYEQAPAYAHREQHLRYGVCEYLDGKLAEIGQQIILEPSRRAVCYGAGVHAADDEHEYQCRHYELGKPFNLGGNAEEKHGRYEYQKYH